MNYGEIAPPRPRAYKIWKRKKGNKTLNQSYKLKIPFSLHRPAPELIPTEEDFLDFVDRELPFFIACQDSLDEVALLHFQKRCNVHTCYMH